MRWSVYFLIDPRNGEPFYVGCSCKPEQRIAQHRSDPASAAWTRCREIIGAGLSYDHRIIADFYQKNEARDYEDFLFKTVSGLENRGPNLCYPKCLCARHDPTPTNWVGNTNWAEEYEAKAAIRRSRGK